MPLDERLTAHFGALRTGADFDARVLARIASAASVATLHRHALTPAESATRAAGAERALARARAQLMRERRGELVVVAALAVLLLLIAAIAAPSILAIASGLARVLAVPLLPGLNLGAFALLLTLGLCFVGRQPRMASRW